MGDLDGAGRFGDDARVSGLAPDLEPDEGNLEAIEREIAVEAQTRRALVVLVGDRASEDERTGDLMVELLEEDGYRVDAVVTSPSEKREVRKALETAVVGGADLVVTVGGVGVSPRDLVPEATRKVLDRRLGGIEQA
ncbi:MAG: molybdopterin-binding protein, partial [Corynebacterium sp.]|nr:molybdopterin-binding protein [Corynebacterium sp.]